MPVKRWIGNRNESDGTTEISLREGTLRLLLGVVDRDTANLTDEELESLTPRFIFTDGEGGPAPQIRRQLYVDEGGETYVRVSGTYFEQPLAVENSQPRRISVAARGIIGDGSDCQPGLQAIADEIKAGPPGIYEVFFADPEPGAFYRCDDEVDWSLPNTSGKRLRLLGQ